MGYTISTHNGSKVARGHNIRDRKITNKEKHIDPKGHYEIWKDETEKVAYKRLFGNALEEYNNKQNRNDRKIEDYHKHIQKDSKKHTCYEIIIQVGNAENQPSMECCKSIYKQYFKGWKERNPNLELIGAYFHNDEDGGNHLHIDYIPFYHSKNRGLSVQNGLEKALNSQGFKSDNMSMTAQMKWEKRENEILERICNDYGLEIEHPKIEGRKHLNTEEYKQQQKIQTLKNQSDKWEELVNMEMQNSEYWEKRIEDKKKELSELSAKVGTTTEELRRMENNRMNLEFELKELERLRNDVEENIYKSLEKWDELRDLYINDLIDKRELEEMEEKNHENDEAFLSSIKMKDNHFDVEMDL